MSDVLTMGNQPTGATSNKKVFEIYPGGPPGEGLKPINVMDLTKIVAGTAKEIGTFDYIDATRQFTVGIWETPPCTEYIPFYPCDEFCYLITGGINSPSLMEPQTSITQVKASWCCAEPSVIMK